MVHLIIETYLSTTHSSSRALHYPWQMLVAHKSASSFWRELKAVVDTDALSEFCSNSTDSFLRCRTIIYLLLNFQSGASTVAEFLNHVENIGSVLIHPHFSMRGSWTNVNRNASPSLVAVETLSTSSPLVEAHPPSIQTVPQYTPVTAAHYSSPTPQLIDEESTSATNQDLYDYPIATVPILTLSDNRSHHSSSSIVAPHSSAGVHRAVVAQGELELEGEQEEKETEQASGVSSVEVAAPAWTWYPEQRRYGRWLPSGAFKWA